MCYWLEFDKRTGKARNKLTVGRLALNIVGLLIVLLIGAMAAVLATYHADWLEQYMGNDRAYQRLTRKEYFLSKARVFKLDANEGYGLCNNYNALKKDMLVFQCGTAATERCIPMDNVCDGMQHCSDNSDEEEAICPHFCEDASKRVGLRFLCEVSFGNNSVSKCMNTKQKCDGRVQCTGETDDKNDESGCYGTTLMGGTRICSEENNWVCRDGMQCIRESDVCNGINNCYDGSDERESVCRD